MFRQPGKDLPRHALMRIKTWLCAKNMGKVKENQ
jgi:hypothetical protein